MKLSIARVSVSSCRSQTSSRIAFLETALPAFFNEVLQQVAFHLRQLILLFADVQLERFEIELLPRERDLFVLVLLRQPFAPAQ